MIKKALVIAAFLTASFTTIFLSFEGCQTNVDKAKDSTALISKNIQDGRMLAQKYCSSCHLPVTAGFLDKETWLKHVLPAMAPRLGIAVYAEDQYVNNPAKKSTLSYDDWMKIVNYYEQTAPAKLKIAKPPVPLVKDWAVFTLKKPATIPEKISTTTVVSVDTNSRTIYSGDATTNNISRWGQSLKAKVFAHLPSPAVDIKYQGKNQSIVTCIGNMRALDVAEGAVLAFNKNEQMAKPTTIISNLPRPVQSVAADFNKDGLTDYVVCGFGHNIGSLYWLKQKPDHMFEKIVVRNVPGAIHAVVGDYNNDGWQDIMCLFAQAQEGVWLFLNNQHGGFSTQNLIRFLPVFGSSSFDVADFNHDGKPDILYTCGDNSDYSKILKPFHGMYIYLNQGNFKFKKSYFYPIDGCTKAVAADFDGDGDLDIASIAFFSDFKNNPSEGFIYFEQDKPMHFIPHAVPVGSYGRWICMDVNDLNHDGKPDIVLGNFSLGFNNIEGFKPNWNLKLPLIVLQNTSVKKLTK
ncbi:MAG: FG-GAP-like repeat-containing protein [Mucilaginibacter sp.]|uniref:FG-GAP-like repeat-containing protein n=1 Tax=Mucilaginibacter sp. TaxID=1882438 RepID=UPI0034E53D0E